MSKQFIQQFKLILLGVRRNVAGLFVTSPLPTVSRRDAGFSLPSLTRPRQYGSSILQVSKIGVYSLALLITSVTHSNAQNFTYKSKLQSVSKKGFYKIQLSSDLASRANSNYEDLRLFDNDGKEVPYLLKKEESFQQESNITYYPILKNNSTEEWQIIIIQNENKSSIDKLILEMKNADANRQVRISGSNDNAQWFVVKDNFEFSACGNSSSSTQLKMLNFPKVDYEYYKIEIKNKNKNPLNIQRIGYTNISIQVPNYQEVKGLSFTRKDSNKNTILHFTCSPFNRIDKLEFEVASPELYHRQANLIKQNKSQESNSSNTNFYSKELRSKEYHPNYSFDISSDSKSILLTNEILGYEKINSFDIVIENNDDTPLYFTSISAYQLNTSLVAELKNNKTYFVYVGDSSLAAPIYDLVYFSSKISDSLPTINIEPVVPKSQKVEEEYSNSNDKLLVWIGLGIVGIILLILTSSMLKKMKTEV